MKTNILLPGFFICAIACWAADSFDVKPGLWEISSTVQMNGMPPIPNFDQMTPEQRARIEAAMKNMAGNPMTNTVKSCITKEGIEKAIAGASNNKNNTCSPKLVNMSASKVTLHVECAQQNGNTKSTGDMSIERRDPQHFTGTGTMKATSDKGRTMDMKWSMTGTFVSADCGNVKPSGQ